MNVKELKDMINLMIEHQLTELELEKDGLKLKLKRETGVCGLSVTACS